MNFGTYSIRTINHGFDTGSTFFFKKRLGVRIYPPIGKIRTILIFLLCRSDFELIGVNPNTLRVFKKKVKSLLMKGTQKQAKNGILVQNMPYISLLLHRYIGR
jgi:hypothetical protein